MRTENFKISWIVPICLILIFICACLGSYSFYILYLAKISDWIVYTGSIFFNLISILFLFIAVFIFPWFYIEEIETNGYSIEYFYDKIIVRFGYLQNIIDKKDTKGISHIIHKKYFDINKKFIFSNFDIIPLRNRSNIVQIKNPRTEKYSKISKKKGKILSHKETYGPYRNIPIVKGEENEI